MFAAAAEIMRGYPGWPAESITKLQTMFKRAFYPQLNVASSWSGNDDQIRPKAHRADWNLVWETLTHADLK